MKKHPEYGWAVLRQVPGMERASLIILHHHESYDGRGLSRRTKGEEIPIGSRIVSVIDAFRRDGFQPSLSCRACPSKKPNAACCKPVAHNSTPEWSTASCL